MNFAEWSKARKKEEKNKGLGKAAEQVGKGALKVTGESEFARWSRKQREDTPANWGSSSNDLIKQIQETVGGGWVDAATIDSYRKRAAGLANRSADMRRKTAGYMSAQESIDSVEAALASAQKYLDGMGEYYGQWDSKDAYDEYQVWNGVADPNSQNYDKDFKQKSQYVSTKNDAAWWEFWDDEPYDDYKYEYLNTRNSGLVGNQLAGATDYMFDYEWGDFNEMTDHELAIYNYYYTTAGKGVADEYLDTIKEQLAYRKGGKIAAEFKERPTADKLVYGASAGLMQFVDGMRNFTNTKDDYIPVSSTQIASSMIREDLEDVGPNLPDWMGGSSLGQMGYDAASTVANMAPSMAIGYINPAAGAVLMGASSAGNSYQELLNEGYTKEQARAYGTLNGISEAALQYALGGVSKLGGKVSGNLISKTVGHVDNAIVRASIKLGGNMLSEGAEESVQEMLTPLFRSMVTGEDYQVQSEDVIYAGLMGAVTAGILEGGGTISGEVGLYKTGKALQAEGVTAQQLAEVGKGLSAESAAYQLAGRVNENTGAYTMGRLYLEIGAQLTAENVADIQKSLERKGVRAKDAKILAEGFAAVAAGAQLTDAQISAIEANDILAQTVVDVLLNPKSTVSQRTAGFNTVQSAMPEVQNTVSAKFNKVLAKNTKTDKVATSSKDTKVAAVDAPETATEGVGAIPKAVEDTAVGEIAEASESVYEASEDGKTRLKSSGQAVTIQKIASVKNGKMTLQLEDGSKVDASEVEYGSADDAIVYETVASLATNAAAANLMLSTYKGSGVPAQVFAKGMEEAYRYGSVGMPAEQMLDRGSFLDDLTDYQLNTGYELGKMFGGRKIAKEQGKTVAKTDTGSKVKAVRKKGRVKGYGVKMKDLGKAFNTAQEQAYRILCQIAEVTGIDIVLFQSKPDANGNLRGGIIDGIDMNDSQGAFSWKNNKIYIDINAGVLKASDLGDVAKYSMLRTFSHEFIHFLEKHDAQQYNVFKDIVFDVMRRNGVDPDALIEDYMKRHKGTTRGAASCEVVAEAMTDILPESNFIQELAQKHKNIFEKLLDRLKEFVAEIKAHFKSMGGNQSKEAAAVKDYMGDAIQYAEGLVEAFDRLAVSAVENYQKAATAQKNTATEGGVQMQTRSVDGNQVVWIEANILKENTGQPVHQFIADYIAEHIGEVYTIIESGQKVYIGEDLPGEYTQSKYTQALLKKKSSVLKAKNRATSNLGEMIEIATNRRWEKTQHTHSKDAKYGMYRYDTRFGFPVKNHKGETVGANVYRAELLIRNASDGKKYLYDLVSIKKDTASSGWLTQRVASAAGKTAGQKGNVSTNSIRNNSGNVNNNSSEEQHQERTNTLTNWDVLEQAAQMLEGQKKFRTKNLNGKTDLNALEKERAELQERLAKQKELGKEAADTAKIRKQIKDIDIAIEAARATLQLTDGQRYALNEFNRRLKNVRELSAQKADQQRILEEQKSGGAEAIEVNRTKNRIDTLNRMIRKGTEELLDIENKAVLKQVLNKARTVIEKEQAALRREAVEKYRDRRNENQKKTEMRRKIRKTIRDLSKLLNHGTKERNVKEGMKELATKTIESAEVLFIDTYTTNDMIRNGVGVELTEAESKLLNQCMDILAQLDSAPAVVDAGGMSEWSRTEKKLEDKLARMKKELEGVFQRERKRLDGTTVTTILGNLSDAYGALKDSEDGYISGAYDENVDSYLKQIRQGLGATRIMDMRLDQLEALHKAYTMVMTTVRNANKAFATNLKESRQELAQNVVGEVRKAGGVHGKWTNGQLKRARRSWNNEKPVYAFERLGSVTMMKLYNNLRGGEDVWAKDVVEAREFFLKNAKKYDFNSWDFKKRHKFTSSSGVEFDLDLQQIMSIYAYSKREQALDHLLKGGFVFDASTEVVVEKGIRRTYRIDSATAYGLTLETFSEITGKLTAEQKGFADAMQEYLSSTMGEKGNEVSMQLYGVKLFNEKFYFPLRSSGAYMEKAKVQEMQKEQGAVSIKNSGFTNATTPKASNPIVLSGFMDVWANHVNDMSLYHAFVLPLEDFTKVYHHSTPHIEGKESHSVNQTIIDAYSSAATGYIDQLLKDINGGVLADPRESDYKAWISKFKKASVMASASVVIQQPSAIARALAYINPKYFGAMTISRGVGRALGNKFTGNHTKLYEELERYAPVATIKKMGYFDTNMGMTAVDFLTTKEYEGYKESGKGLLKDKQYRKRRVDDFMSFLASRADEITWVQIWQAVKNEVADKQKLAVGSEAHLKAAGQRFTEVITKTQVYDSVFARSANMRSKGALMSMTTSFMAEPTTTANMITDAIRKAKKGDVKFFARTGAAVAGSIVFNNLLRSIIYAMRDDDEDETYIEKYLQALGNGIVDDANPLNYLPFWRDIWSLAQGYDVERADMSVISTAIDASTSLAELLRKDTSEMTEEQLEAHNKKLQEAGWRFVDGITSLLGVPEKNIRRDIMGVVNFCDTLTKDFGGRATTANSLNDKVWEEVVDSIPGINIVVEKDSKTDNLYDAIVKGDKAYVARLKAGYKDDSAYHKAIRTGLRENDPRIKQAAVARAGKDIEEYKRIALEIIGEGHFSQDDVVLAIVAEVNAMENGSSSTTSAKHKGIFTGDDFAAAVGQDDYNLADEIKEDIIKTGKKNGKTEEKALESFVSTATSACKEAFLVGDLSDEQAARVLMSYCDKEEYDAWGTVASWSYKQENPESEIPNQWFDTYYKKVETSGLELDVYLEYREKRAAYSLKADILKIIHSLPIGKKQKDALYFAEGWKESTLDEAPWR
ncbi:MAG: hypothetical protein E7466_04215 [Ruminococcaceae bacterium]|nr:hypothetical protein [Oscillospiraceae bacterium]